MFRGYYADAEPFWRVKYGVLSIPDNVDRHGQLVRPCVHVYSILYGATNPPYTSISSHVHL